MQSGIHVSPFLVQYLDEPSNIYFNYVALPNLVFQNDFTGAALGFMKRGWVSFRINFW